MHKYLGLVGMGVEHGIVCIDCFFVLICSMGDVLCMIEMCIEIEEH